MPIVCDGSESLGQTSPVFILISTFALLDLRVTLCLLLQTSTSFPRKTNTCTIFLFLLVQTRSGLFFFFLLSFNNNKIK